MKTYTLTILHLVAILFLTSKTIAQIDTIAKSEILSDSAFFNKDETPKLEILSTYDIKSRIFRGYLSEMDAGYSDVIWLEPSPEVSEYYSKISGLKSFSPEVSFLLTKLTANDINSITPKAFVSGVQKGELLLTESITSGIKYYSILDLNDKVNLLKNNDVLLIASKRDEIINEIIQIRDKYLKANNIFISTKFYIPGKCYANKSNYNLDNQQIDLHVSLDYGIGTGIYIGTIHAPLSLSEASDFFAFAEEFNFPVSFLVSVGSNRKNLGIAGGGVPRWEMPNLIILDNPVISVDFPGGKSYKFITSGFKGELWNPSINTSRWDLNKVDTPFHNYDFNTRIIKGEQIVNE